MSDDSSPAPYWAPDESVRSVRKRTEPISEFEQSLDDMLYAAYADGRADERDELIKVVRALITPSIPLEYAATLRTAIYAMETAK